MRRQNVEECCHFNIGGCDLKMGGKMIQQSMHPIEAIELEPCHEAFTARLQIVDRCDQQSFSGAKSLIGLTSAISGEPANLFTRQALESTLQCNAAGRR